MAACLTPTALSHGWKGIRADGRSFQQFVAQYTVSTQVSQWLQQQGKAYVTLSFEEAYKVTQIHGFAARAPSGGPLVAKHENPDAAAAEAIAIAAEIECDHGMY